MLGTTGVCIVRPDYKAGGFFYPSTQYVGSVPKLPGRGWFQYGDKADQVANLQTALTWANGYRLVVDKDFGACTFAEIVIFQVANGLEPDGQFGAKCLAKLNELIAKNVGKTGSTAPAAPAPAPAAPKHPALYVPQEGEKCYDLSDHQGALSKEYFEGIKKKGVKSVILRSSYTRLAKFERHVDAHFHNNIKNAIAAGMHIGIYHYSSALNASESKQEAQFCLNTIQDYMAYIDLPVAFDCEFGSPKDSRFKSAQAKAIGKTGMGKIVHGFCDVIKAAGYEPMLYANVTMFNNYLPADINQQMKIWVAQWDSKCEYKHPYYMWQFTSNNGKLDENYFGTQGTKRKVIPKPTALPVLPARGWLQKGDKGSEVKKMQQILIYLGFSCGPDGADGDFGGNSESAVLAYQTKYGLTKDKEWGKQCNDKAADLLGLPKPEPTKAQKLADMARSCAWPKGTAKSKYAYPGGSATKAFKDAIAKVFPNRSSWGKQTRAGASCDVFVATCVRAADVDPSFPRGLDGVEKHMKGNSRWQDTGIKDKAKMQPGDVIFQLYKGGGGHIFIYLGGGLIANAHYNGKTYGIVQDFSTAKAASKCKTYKCYRPKG